LVVPGSCYAKTSAVDRPILAVDSIAVSCGLLWGCG